MTQTIASLTVDSLISNGIKNIYCVPGVQNDHFFNALFDRQNHIKAIQTRHEQGAVYMALGAALATGKPQAFSIVPGPGFLNGCAALCTAYALNAPLFGVVGQIPNSAIGAGLGLLHEIENQLDILKSLCKHAERIIDPAVAHAQLNTAWNELRHGRTRPVGIEIPVDQWLKETQYTPADLEFKGTDPGPPDSQAIKAAAKLITLAKKPLIAVGSGALSNSAAVCELATTIGAGVVAFRTGHGVMDGRNPLSINMPVGHRLWPDCDLIIGLGTRLITQKKDWGIDDNIKILHIDIDQDSLTKVVPATLGIHADLKHALPELLAELQSGLSLQPDRQSWQQTIAQTKSAVAKEIHTELAPQIKWLDAIRSALPENGIFVDELTQIGYVSRFAFDAYQPRTFLSTGYQGTLGYGIATALGAAHARPDVPVVSIAGDGGAMFTITELATAVHHNIPLNVVVMNDNAFGNVRGIQRDQYNQRYIASDLSSPDFVKLAESMGVAATRALNPQELNSQLTDAIDNPGPNLIEVPVQEFPSPWKYILLPKVR